MSKHKSYVYKLQTAHSLRDEEFNDSCCTRQQNYII